MGNTQSGGPTRDVGSWNENHGPKMSSSVEYATLEELLQNTRSDRVRTEFYKIPEGQYTDMSEIRVWASTFNLNGRKPPKELDLTDYMAHWQSSWPERANMVGEGSPERADMYVMGFQEAVPLTAQNVIAGWTAAPSGWDNAIDRCLNPWKTDEEIGQSPFANEGQEKSVIDYYVSGWSGVPSANLESRVKASLAEGSSKHEALMRRGSSFDDKKLNSLKGSKGSMSKSNSVETPDLISFDTAEEVPRPKSSSVDLKDNRTPSFDASKIAKNSLRTAKSDEQHEEFLQLFRYQLVGLFVTGWVRKSLVKRISGVQVTTVATGALGYLANKGKLLSCRGTVSDMATVGAIAVRLRIDDSSFVFVTSHLASGSNEGDQIRRNLDFSEIVRRTRFPREVDLTRVMRDDGTAVEDFSVRPEGIPDNATYDVKRAFVGGKWGSLLRMSELDNIIWVGDLNYRITGNAKDVIQLIRTDRLTQLLEFDQLSIERAAGKDFIEAPIDFPPTYKFIRGTAYYTGEIEDESSSDSDGELDLKDPAFMAISKDVPSHPVVNDASDFHVLSAPVEGREYPPKKQVPKTDSAFSEGDIPKRAKSEGSMITMQKKEEKPKKGTKKIRTPAWTDRILWYSSRKQLHQLLYGSFTPISVSDHKPVVATFLMEARKFNVQKVEAALQDARRNVDVEEMASIPRCKISPTVIETGIVYYGVPKEFVITIQNIGETTAVYSFIPPNPGRHVMRSPFPSWLSAQPTSGIIKAGKKETIRLTVCIEGGQWGSADELFGSPEDKLDHILVLHVEGGSDFFVSIIGTYTLSCFGLSLNNLALHLPRHQDKLRRGKITKRTVLPSMQYRESQPYASGWELPAKEDLSADLDDHTVTSSADVQTQGLQHSSSIATTGPRPNLLEGPTGLMIPSQISRMLYFLATEDRLQTPNLFVDSIKQISKALSNKTTVPTVTGIRGALDEAKSFPPGTTSHDMASALLCFFLELPSPMIPESVAQNCEASDVSATMAVNLVKEAMSAIEWSVFDSTMEVMRSALVEANSKKNGLTEDTLARVLCQVFFQDIDKGRTSKTPFKELHGSHSGKNIVECRRMSFIQQFLTFEKPLIELDEATDLVKT